MAKRIAVITGGMGGIGTAICRELHDNGIHVVAGYSRKHEAALQWQAKEKSNNYSFDIAFGDVSDFHSCEIMIKKNQSRYRAY